MTEDIKLILSEAIAKMEGFYAIPFTRAARNHNPGNIEYGKFSTSHGAIGTDGRFAVFPDNETGFKCLVALLKSAYTGLTLEQAINKWAPPSENDTVNYVKCVSQWTDLSSDTVLSAENIF